ncbi:hypothetical protein HW555_003112 [Spodoptera exigua]|uniref:Uncharacterized protein n=1 Tax=Spodoptera exigua TaxID=7107 RepID=A0A835L9M4_SPOEX|nr:hypothetical protein HW555_003112 [Spodoptera exigua]
MEGKHIKWCLLIPMFLASVRAGLNENIAQSFYETPQSSSPTPEPTSTQHPALRGMKEIVLFLTPDQVQILQAAGAVVQPFPEYESDFAELQERFRQSIEYENQMPHQVWMNSSDDIKQNPDILEDYYKLLNIQEINDDLAHRAMLTTTTETTSEMPTTTTPKYKYTKARQQYKDKEYSTPYTPKKTNRPKSNNQNNAEQYVRFLPNYESENLQMVPFQALPLPGYQFGILAESNMQTTDMALSTANTVASTQLQINPEINDPAEIVPNRGVNTETQIKTYPPETGHNTPIAIPGANKPKTPTKPLPTAQTPVAHQDKLAVLLAPLYQHQSITETINHQKQELLNGEFRIRSKLQEMRDSQNYDHKAYTVAVDNLNRNLGQQNVLAKLEASRVSNSGNTGRQPLELVRSTEFPMVVRIPKPQEVKIPAPYPVPLEFMKTFIKVPKPVDNKSGPSYQGALARVSECVSRLREVVSFTGFRLSKLCALTATVAFESSMATFKTSVTTFEATGQMLETSVFEAMVLESCSVVGVVPVVLKNQTTAMFVLSLRVDQFQVLLRLALLERVLQQMAVFFFHVHGDWMEVFEFDRLV